MSGSRTCLKAFLVADVLVDWLGPWLDAWLVGHPHASVLCLITPLRFRPSELLCHPIFQAFQKEREREREGVREKETDIRRQRWRGAHVGKPDVLSSLPCGRCVG